MVAANRKKMLIYAPTEAGGVAEHINYQVLELISQGCMPAVLASGKFLSHKRLSYSVSRLLIRKIEPRGSWYKRGVNVIIDVLNFYILAIFVIIQRPTIVFIDSYSEYYSMLWIWPHLFLSRIIGIRYVTNLHDPVRDYQLGPVWFHKLSNMLAYSIYEVMLVHEKLPAKCGMPKRITILEVPVGVYQSVPSDIHHEKLDALIPASSGKKVFLAFGFIRDNKNLDLFIRAMTSYPEVFLLVAGRNQCAKDKPVSFYQNLANKMGVEERVRFEEGFISDDDLDKYFKFCDYVLLTYDANFHSQSGVLNIAANYKKPILASAGDSPLKNCVESYSLGAFCEPDSLESLSRKVGGILDKSVKVDPDWEGYFEYASWKKNIEILLQELG